MRIFSIAVLLAFAPIAWGQCNQTTNNQDPGNAAYIVTSSVYGNGEKCKMQLCSGGSPLDLTLATSPSLDGNVSLVIGQYCQGYNATTLGCQPDNWALASDQDSAWYYKGCPQCSAQQQCNAAAASVSTNAQMRNQFHLRFIELPYAGRTCYMLKCVQTQCSNMTARDYAYIRSNAFVNSELFYIPVTTNPWQTQRVSSWSEFELPNTYKCPNSFGQTDISLCDVASEGTYWTGSRRWAYINNTECQVQRCDGNNAFPVMATTSSFASGVVNVEFADWIRQTCPLEIQGCYNDVTKWRWDASYRGPNTPRTSCVAGAGFCSQLYCDCSTTLRQFQYVIDRIYSTRNVRELSTGKWGLVVPYQKQECIEAYCDITGRFLNKTVLDTIYFGSMAATDCGPPSVMFYDGTSAAAKRTTFHSAVPASYRMSSTYTQATYTNVPSLLCSALGYTMLSNGQVNVATNSRQCFRSPYYSKRTFTFSNGLTNNAYTNSFSSCSSYSTNPKNYPWVTTSGSGCSPSLSPTTMPTGSCVSNPLRIAATCYQQANIITVDKQFIEMQCYPSKQNMKLETQGCTTISSSRLQDRYHDAFLDQCYADRAAAFNYYQLFDTNCRSGSGVYLSASAVPIYETDIRMQDNQCDWSRFISMFQKVADCECQNVARIYGGGSAAYTWQMQKLFMDNFKTRVQMTYPNFNTLLNELGILGCTYTFACSSSGSATVTVERPKFEAYYIVPTECKNVDWTNLKANLQTVTVNNGGTSSGNGNGRFGGVQMDTANAVAVTTPAGQINCRVKWYTYFVDPDMARWFNGNLTAAAGVVVTPALPKSTNNGAGVVPISFGDSASTVRTTTAVGARTNPSFVIALVLGVICLLR